MTTREVEKTNKDDDVADMDNLDRNNIPQEKVSFFYIKTSNGLPPGRLVTADGKEGTADEEDLGRPTRRTGQPTRRTGRTIDRRRKKTRETASREERFCY
ncbi:hypothetical protein LINPERHAP1_LOCUS187 [Linum perenne]